MLAHFRVVLWSLRVLWDLKTVGWPVDRLRLWRKSVHLYVAFLAFTDRSRPEGQLRRTMICALLSAVYDYDSDWSGGRRDGANFLALLRAYVTSPAALTLASQLFASDVGHKLSTDGLERGSAALRFYALVIDSDWMRGYSVQEIDAFGRKLQIVDDLYDLDQDYLTGDANCLLLEDRAQAFADEAREFIGGEFFARLKANARVYRTIDTKVRKVLDRFGTRRVTFRQLFTTGRPMTAGLYGLALPIVGYLPVGAPIGLQAATALSVTGLTMSIMVFNDWMDRFHDRKKGKFFASEHAGLLWRYWLALNVVTGVCLFTIAWHDPLSALFCAGIWGLGLFYSYVPHWYVAQNLIVALCGGAPVLCGAVWARHLDAFSGWTFVLLAALLFVSEVYKDIEDARIDPGYKETVPVRQGHVPTVVLLIAFLFAPALLMVLHPQPWMKYLAGVGLPLVMWSQVALLVDRAEVARTRWLMKWLVTAVLLALLVAPEG